MNLPFQEMLRKSDPPPVDVCADAYGSSELPFGYDVFAESAESALEKLAAARVARAKTLYDLWMGPSLAADDWVMAEIGEAVTTIKKLSRTPAPK